MSGAPALRIAVVGAGYVGLVTAACLAELGHAVTAVDSDRARIAALGAGGMPFFEPGLQGLVAAHRMTERLRFTHRLDDAVRRAELVFIAVGTPTGGDGASDLRAVEAAVFAAAAAVQGPATLVLKSTVPVGTHERLRRALAERQPDGGAARLALVSNPEFLREGSAIGDFLRPDRIIVGADDEQDAALLLGVFAPLVEAGAQLLCMNPRSAELAKYASNGMLAARISFMNEMAQIADATGADIEAVRAGVGSDRRIGSDFLRAGIGYGGSCFPKDVRALAHLARQHGLEARMLDAVAATNERHKRLLFDKMASHYRGEAGLRGKRIALWGLAFKPGTDDLREAPSLVLLEQLAAAGAEVAAYDPVAVPVARRLLGERAGLCWCHSAADALAGADALAVVTEWQEFVSGDPAAVQAALADGVVFDGRNCLPCDTWRGRGLQVIQVGRPARDAQVFRAHLTASTMP
ncbi:UDP-glucose/GDP-mannose dehydrogenase family protein [Rhizobacter sp. SG703]|uniref:UDP-glucose dehydrogenase family protein n=1 Tax=Rhizobacter sp. SG703 TaxID=2587140 RepID=UPI00181CBBF0|nr:UDPglucose 6-dehydrogenase [Rhizobacter sp. SG703]